MRNMILQKDYEKYELILPYKAAFGRAKQRFIYSELEKLHPCFSDEYCFDSCFRRVTKKGISSDVVVMHKYKLAEYESRQRFSGLGFALCESGAGARPVAKPMAKRFVSPKIKLAVRALLLLVIFLAVCFFWKIDSGKKGNGESYVVEFDAVEKTDIVTDVLTDGKADGAAAEDFFEVITKNGGVVNMLRWSTDFFTETIEAEIEGVFPESLNEKFPDCNLSSVKYTEGKPKVNFKNVQKLDFRSAQKSFRNREKFFQLQTSIRKVLEEKSAELKEESQNPYRIVFHCSRKNFIDLISALYDAFTEQDFLITEIMYSVIKNEQFEVSIASEDSFNYAKGLPVNKLSEKLLPEMHSSAFVKKGKNQMADSFQERFVAAEKPGNSEDVYGSKVGEITRSESYGEGKIKTIRTVFLCILKYSILLTVR